MKEIIEIPQDHKRVIDNLVTDGKGYLLPHVVETRLAKAVKIGTVIPDNATNGDIIKAIFPNARVEAIFPIGNCDEVFYIPIEKVDGVTNEMRVMKSWWDAPYKGESEGNNADSN